MSSVYNIDLEDLHFRFGYRRDKIAKPRDFDSDTIRLARARRGIEIVVRSNNDYMEAAVARIRFYTASA